MADEEDVEDSLIREIKPFLVLPPGLFGAAPVESRVGTDKPIPLALPPGLVGTAPTPLSPRPPPDEVDEEEDMLRAFFHSFLVPLFTRRWISGGSCELEEEAFWLDLIVKCREFWLNCQ